LLLYINVLNRQTLHSIQHNLLPAPIPAVSMHTNTHVDGISSKSTEEYRMVLARFRLDELNVLITQCVDKLNMKLPVILIALCIVPLYENKRVSIYLFSF
jgi:hypothetical protein